MSDEVEYLDQMGRGLGKTTAICEAAKKINATVVCHNRREVKRIEQEFGVNAVSINEGFRGTKGPYLVDTTAVSAYATMKNAEIKQLRAENEKLQEALSKSGNCGHGKLQQEILELQSERDRLKALVGEMIVALEAVNEHMKIYEAGSELHYNVGTEMLAKAKAQTGGV